MPLKSGKSKAVHSANVAEMMRGYKAGGKIGNTTPGSVGKAVQIANAAAYSKARGGRPQPRGKATFK